MLKMITAILAALLLLSACGQPYTFRGGTVEPAVEASDFTLTDMRGQPFRLSEHRGKIVMLFFGFTNCPDICPTAMSDLAKLRRELGGDAEQVVGVFVTLDRERDTPERLQRYLGGFDKTFYGLTGTPEQLAQVEKAYGVTSIRRELPDSAIKYTIDHSTFIYAIDKTGKLRVLFPHGSTVDDMLSDVRYLLRES